MGYNPFDFLGTDKRKRISPKVMGLAHDVVTEHKLREMVRAELKNLTEEDPCWKGYKQIGMKDKDGKKVPNCVPVEEEYDVVNEQDYKDFISYMKENYSGLSESTLEEAEYQGRKVKLGKPSQGDVKKFKVYVKNPKGNVVKVNFGQGGDAKGGTMRIRKDNPKARKSFRARHNCDNPGPRHKARYWSCRKW